MTAAIPPLAEDAARLAWSVRSVGQLVDLLAGRHPDVGREALFRAACSVLIPDVEWTERTRLQAEARELRTRVAVLESALRELRGTALDAWLGEGCQPSGLVSLAEQALAVEGGDIEGAVRRLLPICPGRSEAEVRATCAAVRGPE